MIEKFERVVQEFGSRDFIFGDDEQIHDVLDISAISKDDLPELSIYLANEYE
ncbi:hypothetical protein [Paenibacillus alginolyticus]|uniref:Uncharacterized protein n=1 Tax=Paenibacillus alginolyticus TaxID=59839 RepID=A0ABT4GDS6_9BACL|nr:hypothetical protein [Paenibacillus alginolyticus]MCY9694348.1 hypothetical protein [Paenibacillus alginolyticus]MEC0147517.1 hypothetical protein [Paenibacillus alginolyticus]